MSIQNLDLEVSLESINSRIKRGRIDDGESLVLQH